MSVFTDNKLIEALRSVADLGPALQAVVDRMDKMESALRATDETLQKVIASLDGTKDSLDGTRASLDTTDSSMTEAAQVITAAAGEVRTAAQEMSAVNAALGKIPGIKPKAS